MYQSMVEWTKRIDRAWKYDYTAYDTYVYNDEAGASCQNIIAAPAMKAGSEGNYHRDSERHRYGHV